MPLVFHLRGMVAVVPLSMARLDLLPIRSDEALLPADPSWVKGGVPTSGLCEADVWVVWRASRRGREGGVAVCREEALAVVVDLVCPVSAFCGLEADLAVA